MKEVASSEAPTEPLDKESKRRTSRQMADEKKSSNEPITPTKKQKDSPAKRKSPSGAVPMKLQNDAKDQITDAILKPKTRASNRRSEPVQTSKRSNRKRKVDEEENSGDGDPTPKKSRISKKTDPDVPKEGETEQDVKKTPASRKKKAASESKKPDSSKAEAADSAVICGKCDESFPFQKAFDRHSIAVHGAMARPKGESQEFTDAERIAALKVAFKLVKEIPCYICKRKFTSHLGLKFHWLKCGKSDEEVEVSALFFVLFFLRVASRFPAF